MNLEPEKNWKRVTRRELTQYLDTENHIRDAWSNVDLYRRHGTDVRIAAKFTDGRCYIIPTK